MTSRWVQIGLLATEFAICPVRDWTANWRLPAIVGVVDNCEKRALSSKKSQVRTDGVQNHNGGIKKTELLFDFPTLAKWLLRRSHSWKAVNQERAESTVELGVKGMFFYSSIPFTPLLVSVFD
eukprot:scaffold62402_cov42-Cyclotella_meneghiniana.AAC.4